MKIRDQPRMKVYEPISDVPKQTVFDSYLAPNNPPKTANNAVDISDAKIDLSQWIQKSTKPQIVTPNAAPRVTPIRIAPMIWHLYNMRRTIRPATTAAVKHIGTLHSSHPVASAVKASMTQVLNPPNPPSTHLNQRYPNSATGAPIKMRAIPNTIGLS